MGEDPNQMYMNAMEDDQEMDAEAYMMQQEAMA